MLHYSTHYFSNKNSSLTREQEEQLNDLAFDIWQRESSIGELYFCEHCSHMYSLEEHMQYSQVPIKREDSPIFCPRCHHIAELMYTCFSEKLRNKMGEVVWGILILAETDEKKVAGWTEIYMGTLDTICTYDLYHYAPLQNQVQQSIKSTLGYAIPENIICLASTAINPAIHESGVSLSQELLTHMARVLPVEYRGVPAISEISPTFQVGTRAIPNPLYRKAVRMGGITLDIAGEHRVQKKSEKYISSLLVHRDVISSYRRHFLGKST